MAVVAVPSETTIRILCLVYASSRQTDSKLQATILDRSWVARRLRRRAYGLAMPSRSPLGRCPPNDLRPALAESG
jgi:hypothetical protein